MSAKTIARSLGGRRAGTTWMTKCPAHPDREPSLSTKDGDGGRVLVRCHAGPRPGAGNRNLAVKAPRLQQQGGRP
jgi:hypothetical protein